MADSSLAASVIRSVNARGDDVGPADQAAVDLALRYATQIDAAVEAGGLEATKGLYLGPHLLKALDALGCTPASRSGGVAPDTVGNSAPSGPGSKLAAMKRRRDGGGA